MPKPKIFTAEEYKTIRDAINRLRHPGSYQVGKWMVSHLNRRQEVVNGRFPAKVRLRDITLRALEQMPGVVSREEDRRRLLVEIVRLGVPEVQMSAFGRGHTLEEMRAEVATVKEVNPDCLAVYGRIRSVEDIELAARAGYEIVQLWASPFAQAAIYGGGVYHLAWEGKDWRSLKVPSSVEEQIARASSFIQAGKELGVKLSTGINMLPYASDEYVKKYCQAMSEAGAYEIMLYDGPSGVGPEAFVHLVRLARKYAPSCVIGVHTHNMFDLATANSLAAAREGAEVIEVSVNGYCAASGQADIAAVAVSLAALYGVETGIDLGRLTGLARMAEEFTGRRLAWNHPVTGEEVFNWGGMETIVQELEVDPLIHWCLEPALVGNERKWSITRDSGPYTMWDKLDQLGIEVEKRHVEPILRRCLALIQQQRGPVTDDQIRQIARAVTSNE